MVYIFKIATMHVFCVFLKANQVVFQLEISVHFKKENIKEYIITKTFL